MKMIKITTEHKERVLQISKNISEGDDYIQEIFNDWVADAYGEFVGFFVENKIVAFSKMTYLTPTDVRLEGLRNHRSWFRIQNKFSIVHNFHWQRFVDL